MVSARPDHYTHQLEARRMIRKRRKAARLKPDKHENGTILFMDPGTGKTRPIIEEIEKQILSGKSRLFCVVNILSGMYVWVQAWHEWAATPVLFIDLREHRSEGLRTAVALAKAGQPVICIVNYDSARLIGQTRVKKMRKGQEVSVLEPTDTTLHDVQWDMCVIDEAHKIKTPGSKLSLYFRNKVRPVCRERFALTGTGYTKRPIDAWPIVKFVSGEEVFPGNAKQFTARYGVPHPYIRGAFVAWQNLDDFARRLSTVAVLAKKEDCMDLPPVTHSYRKVELSPKARKMYDSITRDLYAELEEFEAEGRAEYSRLVDAYEERAEKSKYKQNGALAILTADDMLFRDDVARHAFRVVGSFYASGTLVVETEEIVAMLRKQAKKISTVTVEHVFAVMAKQAQIASGFVIPDAPEDDPGLVMEPVDLGSNKVTAVIDALEGIWEDRPAAVVVGYNYEELMYSRAIESHFKFKPKVLNGSVKGAERRHRLVHDAAKDPVFILKAQVGSESIDLRAFPEMIMPSATANTIRYKQLLARNDRGGQTQNVHYTHIVAENTVDERFLAIVQSDLNVEEKINKNWRAVLMKSPEEW